MSTTWPPKNPSTKSDTGRTAIPTHKEFAFLPAALLKLGYSESDPAKIIGGNFMRLFREVAV